MKPDTKEKQAHRGRTARPASPGSWLARGFVASARGLALSAEMIAQCLFTVVVLCVATLAMLGVGLYLLPGTLLGARRLASLSRRRASAWEGTGIPAPYRPRPREGSRWQWLITDPATWRDLLWLLLNPTFGWLLTLMPGALITWGLFGVVMPAVWKPILDAHSNNWYAMIHVINPATAWLCVPLGAAFMLAGVAVAPLMLRSHGRLAHFMLAPAQRAELAERVEYLTATRSDLADTRAAEIRRIERDLHDGAQARLVAMGMTLSAAERALKNSPEAAMALLVEARHNSVKALADLRDLIRGIYPPVLADRGLSEAVRALAMDSPLNVEVVNALHGRADAAVESAAYFAVSELLANVIKHAHAQHVSIDLRYQHGSLRIDVTDDGQGGANPSQGTGLHGIERRLAAFDGILAVGSPLGGPTMVSMELPCVLSSPKTSSC